MAKIVFGGALSHSPMMNLPSAEPSDQVVRFKSAVQELTRRLQDSNAEVLLVFGPDHFRTLFYDLMPAFTIGVGEVRGWGDWNTPAGPFEVQTGLAEHIIESTLKDGFEPAFSREIKVDHGITQPLQLMNVNLPMIPVVINCAAPPLPTPWRCYSFGAAIERAIRSWPENIRVALIASGGLSHDPPAPSRENALHGRTNGFAASRERETLLMKRADELQARINPEWDRMVLDRFTRGEVSAFAATLNASSIHEAAGNGGQEIRTWLALAGALGDLRLNVLFYEPIAPLITGMGVVAL